MKTVFSGNALCVKEKQVKEGQTKEINGKIYKLAKIETSRVRAYSRSGHLRDKGYKAQVETFKGPLYGIWVYNSANE